MMLLAVALTTILAISLQAQTETASAGKLSSEIAREPILTAMRKVADWQLSNPSPTDDRNPKNGWTYGAFYTGVMALDGIDGTPKYHDAMVEMGRSFDWKPARRRYHADDHCVCQTYLELYLKDKDAAMLQPTKDAMDYILANPSTNSMYWPDEGSKNRWCWCDSLFMAPPVWARLYKATGDRKYLDFMDKEWWVTANFLYDKKAHLFYRDSTYFDRQEANGKGIFWSRGNGWVLAGLPRVLEMMPANYPHRKRYETLFKEMAASIAALQQADGLWRVGLLDPDSYPFKETSGSAFHTYGLAWGINHGLLKKSKYEPVVRKAWTALVDCVTPDGKLEHVQPAGAGPKAFDPTETETYGAGAFLLAGSEMYRLAPAPRTKR